MEHHDTDLDFAPLTTINYWNLTQPGPTADQEALKLFDAVRSLGFFYLDLNMNPNPFNLAGRRSIDELNVLADTSNLFHVIKGFFDLTTQEKMKYSVPKEGGYFGSACYKCLGASFIDRDGTPDCNEFYNISKDDVLAQDAAPLPQPTVFQQAQPLIKSFVVRSHHIIETLLGHLSASLDLHPTLGIELVDASSHNPKDVLPDLHRLDSPSEDVVSFIKYPVQDPPQETQPLASHTDYGSLTLLYTTQLGLQVLLPTSNGGKWAYVKPLQGHAIVNCGDALAIFSNGVLRSNVHRVVSQAERCATEPRYSLGYFCRPAHEVYMQPLKGSLIPPASDFEGLGKTKCKDWVRRRSKGRLLDRYRGEADWEDTAGTEKFGI